MLAYSTQGEGTLKCVLYANSWYKQSGNTVQVLSHENENFMTTVITSTIRLVYCTCSAIDYQLY